MNSDFIVDNKNYISDKRACGIYGYSSNYLKELCDSRVIDNKLKDGTVFVCEDSIKAHKLGLLSSNAVRRLKVNLEPLSGKILPIKSHLDHKAGIMVFSSIAFVIFFVLLLLLMKVLPVSILNL